MRKTLDEGLYLVYTFQVQKDKSKFLGLNGTKLDIIVRLHLLVFLNQITFFYLVCKKISFFLLTGFSVEKIWLYIEMLKRRGCMRLPKGYSFCTDETSYCLHDKKLFASQVNDTYIRHFLRITTRTVSR